MKVYAVTFDGYLDEFGSSMHILGIYSSKEEADNAIEITSEKLRNISVPAEDHDIKEKLEEDLSSSMFFAIREIEINETPNLDYDEELWEIVGGTYIGGYIE